MDLLKIENSINKLQEMNKAFMIKNIRFFIYLFINGLVFSVLTYVLLRTYDFIGFEKTIIILAVMVFLTQLREQYKRA